MDAEDAKDLEKYIRDKRRAEAKCNLNEVAQLCNCIGELYSKYGRYEDAVQEHSQERFLSEMLGDKIGAAVACRKIGENLCSQGLYKEALELQKKHLTIARECGNHIEEQRAWATIGRTYLSQAETKNIQESLAASKKSEKAFVKALETCDKIKASVKPVEYMSMKGRVYLNLGLVFELRGDLKDSADMMKRAVVIAEKFKLHEESYLCHGSLANLYHKGNQFSQALRSLDVALAMAEKLRNKVWERETYIQKAAVLANCADFLTAKHCLKKAHKLKVESDVSEQKLVMMFQCVNKMQEASQDLQTKTDEKELAKLYEVMADSAAELGNFAQAIEHYLKVLEFSTVMSKNERADIYVSLAQSYADIRQYDNAIFYYNKELSERSDDLEQACRTYLNIAELKELQGCPYPSVCKIYLSAYEAAKKAKHAKLQIQTLKSLMELQKTWKQTIHLEETQRKLGSLLQKNSSHGKSDSEEEEGSQGSDKDVNKAKDDDGNLSLSDLTVSEESDSDHGTVGVGNKNKFVRRNEKGETALHRACIDGNLKKVKSLIGEGHPVNPRDFCGWLPLHEACNHGHVTVVEYLLDAGAWINDRGGERCGGVTPLIDAANCGHLDIVKLLVDRGAQVMAKDDDGNTALDCLRAWYSRTGDVLELADEVEYKKIEKLLQGVTGNHNLSCEPGPSKTCSSYKPAAQKGGSTILRNSPEDTEDLLLPEFVSSDVKAASKSKTNKHQKSALNERLRKLRQKRETKAAGSSTHRTADAQDCFSSSDDEPLNIYRSSQLPSSGSNFDLPGRETYRLAITAVGRSAAHKQTEMEVNSDASDGNDKLGGNQPSALVDAEEDVGDDWLVNDIEWPQAKRKSAAVNNVLTTRSSRNVTRKRLRNDVNSKMSDRVSKRNRYPQSDEDRQMAAVGHDDDDRCDKFRSNKVRPGRQEASDNACVVSSTTETVLHGEQKRATSNRGSEYQWDSDDDMLFQIDTIYDSVNKSNTDIVSSQNDSMTSSLITSSPRAGRETAEGHLLQPVDGHIDRAGHCTRKPSTHFEKIYRSEAKNSSQAQNSSEGKFSCNNTVQTSYGSESNNILVTELGHSSAVEKFEKPTYVNSIRVKVKIGQQTLLIPIQPADQDKTISWLFQQVKERYFSMFLMLPTLTLSTQDGIILCPADTISMILQDSDILTANVSAWERPKLEDRYIQACKLCLANANTNIISSLQKTDQSGQLQLSDMGLGLSYLQPVFQALEDHKTLTELRLNGNRLGDAGIESLMKLLPSLPHLKILSLETNGISADGIQNMAAGLKSDVCLQHLSTLSLSHNCLDDIAAEALACIVRSLPNLCQLSLSSCNFSQKLFSSSLSEAFKEKRIELMNISENSLGHEGIKDLMKSLNPGCLTQLNISHTCSMSHQDISPFLLDFVSREVSCLQELSLAGNHLSPADVTFLNRLPVLVKSLRCLVLSQNQNINNKSLQKLLYLSADKDSCLSEITARGCSITSPLESELLDAIRSKMSCPVPLKKFVFTCRGLKADDSQLLEEIWLSAWKEQGHIKADGMAVFLTVNYF